MQARCVNSEDEGRTARIYTPNCSAEPQINTSNLSQDAG
jgi:hypothetical protein